jgi:hypothetical protein
MPPVVAVLTTMLDLRGWRFKPSTPDFWQGPGDRRLRARSLQFLAEREPNIEEHYRGFCIQSRLKCIRRRGRGGFHEDVVTSEGTREHFFSPSSPACDVLACYGLHLSYVGRADSRLFGKVKDRSRTLILTSAGKGDCEPQRGPYSPNERGLVRLQINSEALEPGTIIHRGESERKERVWEHGQNPY